MEGLVYCDDKPEEGIDRSLISALHDSYKPDDRPAAIQDVVSAVDDSKPPQRKTEVEEGRQEG